MSADGSLFGGRRLVGRAALKLTGEGAARGVAFLVTLWLARALGEASFGFYSYALAAGFVIAQVADLGIQVLITREVAVADRRAAPLVLKGLRLKGLLCVAALGLVLGLATTHTRGVGVVVIALGVAMILVTFVDYAAHVFRGRGEMGQEVRLTAGYVLTMAAAVTVALLLGGKLLAVSIASAMAAAAVAMVALWRLRRAGWLKRTRGWGDSRRTIDLLRAAAPLGLATFASIAYSRLAVLLLEGMSGEVAVAHFSVAQRLVEAAHLLPAAAMAAVFPAYSALWRRPGGGAGRLAFRVGVFLSAAGLAGALILHYSASWLVPALFGEAYREGSRVLSVLAFAIPLMFVNHLLLHLLIARGRQSLVTALTVGVLLVHGLLCALLIARWGVVGAAIAVVLSEIVLLLGAFACVERARPAPGLMDAPDGKPEDAWVTSAET